MINPENILKSTKRVGKYELDIIKDLQKYFSNLGYHAIPHARFDIAWGSILSDLDLLLIKNDQLILIEVKSSKDNLSRARKQIDAIEDFVDEVYIATDYEPKKWPSRKAGRIIVRDNYVNIIRESKILNREPKLKTLLVLRKSSLNSLLINSESGNNLTKYQIARKIQQSNTRNLKNEIKQIVTCQ
ncbi:hypothetical protein [Candidatus Nitrosarchaeum limnium]|jgi:hypothetical protein|uniref:Uncharacterized protein n=1 Tax=Candidatus Nitrosarchaeum limnium BG20 TaxID=859192 RepID=S2ER01_9ARCH|nr:hypothetical protein [Candidatus Nitrosarchaeum limnium]EPA06872.1 hypothetical protein BG20_I1446 [Candidatus Nitrosarchaeum limnium BG20]